MQSDAVNKFGEDGFFKTLTATLAVAIAFVTIMCFGGGVMRNCVSTDGAFATLPMLDSKSYSTPPKSQGLGSCSKFFKLIGSLGP